MRRAVVGIMRRAAIERTGTNRRVRRVIRRGDVGVQEIEQRQAAANELCLAEDEIVLDERVDGQATPCFDCRSYEPGRKATSLTTSSNEAIMRVG